jgi:hypothetical protein
MMKDRTAGSTPRSKLLRRYRVHRKQKSIVCLLVPLDSSFWISNEKGLLSRDTIALLLCDDIEPICGRSGIQNPGVAEHCSEQRACKNV